MGGPQQEEPTEVGFAVNVEVWNHDSWNLDRRSSR